MENKEWWNWLTELLDALGPFFLVDYQWHPRTKKLEIFVDKDGGISLDECQQISKALSTALDIDGRLGEDYMLDVSSPGVDKPLRFRRQYENNVGRFIEVRMKESNSVIGKLMSTDDAGIRIVPEIREKKGKKTLSEETTIEWEKIDKTFVQIRF